MDANASCCLLHSMQQGFSLGRRICKKRNIICMICIDNSFCCYLMCDNNPPADPHYLNQPSYAWPSESSSDFSSLAEGISPSFTDTQNATEWVKEKEETNKHGFRLTPSARGEVCDIFCAFCELTRAFTRAKTLTKPLLRLT